MLETWLVEDGGHSGVGFVEMAKIFAMHDKFSLKHNHLNGIVDLTLHFTYGCTNLAYDQ